MNFFELHGHLPVVASTRGPHCSSLEDGFVDELNFCSAGCGECSSQGAPGMQMGARQQQE